MVVAILSSGKQSIATADNWSSSLTCRHWGAAVRLLRIANLRSAALTDAGGQIGDNSVTFSSATPDSVMIWKFSELGTWDTYS